MASQIQEQSLQYDFAAQPQIIGRPKYRNSVGPEEQDQIQEEDIVNPYEELTDIPPDDESDIRPDFYIDRPPTPEYKPKEKGVDVETQIEAFEPELFDFELEVEPILQVIVGKITEQARIEIIEEDEKEALKLHKQQYQKKRNAELMVTQRMETAFLRRKEERERRDLQHDLYNQQLKLTQKKLIARQLSKICLQGAQNRILNDLESLGYLRDNYMMNLRQYQLPWFINKIYDRVNRKQNFNQEFQDFLLQTQTQASIEHRDHVKVEMDRRATILAERERIRIEIEERKKRKAEIKRRWALRDQREILKQEIQEKFIDKSEGVEQVYNSTILEGINELGPKQYICLTSDLLLLISLSMDFMIDDNIDQIDEDVILSFWIDLLSSKMTHEFVLVINDQFSQLNEESLQEMEQDPYIFNKKQKQNVIQHFIQSINTIWANYQTNLTFNLSKNSDRLETLIKKLLVGLLDIHFKSINYIEQEVKIQDQQPNEYTQEQEQEGEVEQEQEQEQAENNGEEKQEQPSEQQQQEEEYVKPDVTETDLEMIEARKRLHLKFKKQQTELPSVDTFIILHIPYQHIIQEKSKSDVNLSINASKDQGKNISHSPGKTMIKDNSQIDMDILAEDIKPQDKKSKWDFDPKTIDIFDGEIQLVREGRQISMEDEEPYAYNLQGVSKVTHALIYDERSNYLARKQIYKVLKDRLEGFLNIISFEQFIEKFQNLDRKIFDSLKHDIMEKYPNIPIFEYEL